MRSFLWLLVSSFMMAIPNLASGQSIDEKLAEVEQQLKSGQKNVSDILQDDALMPLHSLTRFRDLIKLHAPVGSITIVSPTEVGTPITVRGTILDNKKMPVRKALLYLYQTSDAGWYSDTAAHILVDEGDMRHARLFGYVWTDDRGQFTLKTIKPNGSPKSSLAAGIKIQIWDQAMNPLQGPAELQFEDDPRMTWHRKKQSLEDGIPVSKNTGSLSDPVYEYLIVVK